MNVPVMVRSRLLGITSNQPVIEKSYFRSQIRLAFNVATDQDWETNQSNRSGQTINLDSDNDGDVDTDDSPFVGDTDGGDLPAFREAYLEEETLMVYLSLSG